MNLTLIDINRLRRIMISVKPSLVLLIFLINSQIPKFLKCTEFKLLLKLEILNRPIIS